MLQNKIDMFQHSYDTMDHKHKCEKPKPCTANNNNNNNNIHNQFVLSTGLGYHPREDPLHKTTLHSSFT